MPTDADPIEGNWYQRLVEIQHFDGDLEEIDFDAWYAMEIEPIEAPEDWTGPMNEVEPDDLGYTETGMKAEDWKEPLGPGVHPRGVRPRLLPPAGTADHHRSLPRTPLRPL